MRHLLTAATSSSVKVERLLIPPCVLVLLMLLFLLSCEGASWGAGATPALQGKQAGGKGDSRIR